MTKNPLLNALSATGYISLVVFLMTVAIPSSFEHKNEFLAPIVFISMFTLSAAIMGYIFCYQPLMLYFDNKRKHAVHLFLQTIGFFALTTFLVYLLATIVNFS